MPITGTDLKVFKSQKISDTPSQNGGRRSNIEIISGARNSVFNDLTEEQRSLGAKHTRKECLVNHNTSNLAGQSPWVAMDYPTAYGDMGYFIPASATALESDLTGAEEKYSAGLLTQEAASGSNTLVITMEPGLENIFADGDSIWVHTKQRITGTSTGKRERHSISGAPVVAGQQVTITLVGTLVNTMPVGAKVCRIYRHSTSLAPGFSLVSQSGTGSYDFTGYPLQLNNLGSISQRWTVDYISTSQASVSGDDVGALGTFALNADIEPINAFTGQPYFTLQAGGHGSSHVAGDKLIFDTTGAELHYFVVRDVPPGTGVISLEDISTSYGVESPQS